MKIVKVLNNNAAIIHNQAGQEIIVLGKGLAFQAKVGDLIDESKIERTFTNADNQQFEKYQQLIENIPFQYLMLSDRVINYAKNHFGKKLGGSIYITLPDHIAGAIARYENGIVLRNTLLWDIKRFYQDEFQIGCKALTIIGEETGMSFDLDEAAFIAMHFVNAQDGKSVADAYKITTLIHEILDIVEVHFNMLLDEESLDYYRFVTHLRFCAQRLFYGQKGTEDSDNILEIIQEKYPQAYECACKVGAYLQEKHSYEIVSEEILYLTVHIARVTKNKKQ